MEGFSLCKRKQRITCIQTSRLKAVPLLSKISTRRDGFTPVYVGFWRKILYQLPAYILKDDSTCPKVVVEIRHTLEKCTRHTIEIWQRRDLNTDVYLIKRKSQRMDASKNGTVACESKIKTLNLSFRDSRSFLFSIFYTKNCLNLKLKKWGKTFTFWKVSWISRKRCYFAEILVPIQLKKTATQIFTHD